MRLWSLHPHYLDRKGLEACWHEGLEAKKILESNTKADDPQLIRFLETPDPVMAINAYLGWLVNEARERGLRFELSKLQPLSPMFSIEITEGQLKYELEQLAKEVAQREPDWSATTDERIQSSPRFTVVQGGVADWEVA